MRKLLLVLSLCSCVAEEPPTRPELYVWTCRTREVCDGAVQSDNHRICGTEADAVHESEAWARACGEDLGARCSPGFTCQAVCDYDRADPVVCYSEWP